MKQQFDKIDAQNKYNQIKETDYTSLLNKEEQENINISYTGWDEWIIVTKTISSKEFTPSKDFPKLIKRELKVDDISNFEILNHNMIILPDSRLWVTIVVGLKRKYKSKGF